MMHRPLKQAHPGVSGTVRGPVRVTALPWSTPPFSQANLHRMLGNQGVQVLINQPVLQAKLRISQPGDAYELEADRIADRVMRVPNPDVVNGVDPSLIAPVSMQRKCVTCDEQEERDRRKTQNGMREMTHAGSGIVPRALHQGGQPLDADARAFFEPRFGVDFGDVRVHTGTKAAQSARSLNALAYTVGRDMVFNDGQYAQHTESGRRLLAHELAHVTQQSSMLQRRISPEEVSGELIGQTMSVVANFSAPAFTVQAGDTVEIVAWSNTSDDVTVQLLSPHVNGLIPFAIPKILLRPIAGASGLDQYSSGISDSVASINRGDARIAAERTRRGGPRPGEIPRSEGLQRNRRRTLNRRLIQEIMFNRFDANIVSWVNFYSAQFAASSFGSLDANLVKAMLFQESELGTSGEFMSVAPANREMGIHNLGQVIDSSAAALLILMREIEPTLITQYNLQNIAPDTAARPRGVSAEDFMWAYVASGQTQGFQDAVDDFYATAAGTMRDTDYDFWIRAAVRWLFEKRRSVGTWAEAIRAYNGGGARARRYRDAVTGRARDAAAATAAGQPFVPGR